MATFTNRLSRPVCADNNILDTMMKGSVTAETTIAAPADTVWAVYSGKTLGFLVNELAQDVVGKVEFPVGDGGVGTILKLTFPPGTPGIGYMHEEFKVNDDETRTKVTEVVEGRYKELGFDLYRIKLEILEKDAVSSIVRSSIEYEFNDSLGDLTSHVDINVLKVVAQMVNGHLQGAK